MGAGDGETCQMLRLETDSSDREGNPRFQRLEMNHPHLQKITSVDNLDHFDTSVSLTLWFLMIKF